MSAALKTLGTVALVVVVMVAGFGLWAHVTVHEGHVGVQTEKGAATGDVLEPDWHFINPVTQGVHAIETRPRTVTYNGDENVSIISKDGQDVFADVTIRYSVESDKAVTFFREYRAHGQARERLIEPTVRSELRDEGSDISVRTLITQEGRESLETTLSEALRENFDGTGLTLEAVQLRDTEPNAEFSRQLENIEIENAKAEQRIIEAESKAEAEVKQAEGDAEAHRIRNAALTDKVLMDKYLDQIQGSDKVILATDGDGTPVILNADSEGSSPP